MGEAMQDLLNYAPATPVQFIRDRVSEAAASAQRLVQALDFGKFPPYPENLRYEVNSLITDLEMALDAAKVHRVEMERRLLESVGGEKKVKWYHLEILSEVTGRRGYMIDSHLLGLLESFRWYGRLDGKRVVNRLLDPSWPDVNPEEVDWDGFEEELRRSRKR